MKNVFFWNVMSCGCCRDRRLGETYRLHLQGDYNQRNSSNISSNYQLLHAAKNYFNYYYTLISGKRLRGIGRRCLTEHISLKKFNFF
jgi:hypothetical protein